MLTSLLVPNPAFSELFELDRDRFPGGKTIERVFMKPRLREWLDEQGLIGYEGFQFKWEYGGNSRFMAITFFDDAVATAFKLSFL